MEYDNTISHKANLIRAVIQGMTEDEFIKLFGYASRAYARLTMYKIRKGIIRDVPPASRKPRTGRRNTALLMFAEGKTVSEVVAATGLKRSTAHNYAYEQRQMAAHQADLAREPTEAAKSILAHIRGRDPLCD